MVATFASCSSEPKKGASNEQPEKNAPTKFVVLIISGYDSDPSPEQIEGNSIRGMGNSGMFQLKGDLEQKGLECKFFNWNGTPAGKISQNAPPGADGIESWIQTRIKESPGTKFILIGHSWGGHTIFDVAARIDKRESVRFPLTVLLDPSSALRGSCPTNLPPCLNSVVNYHTANMFCWGALKLENQVENIFLGDPSRQFMKKGFPDYSSSFDVNAHNAAEWDQNIHSDIASRILRLVNSVH